MRNTKFLLSIILGLLLPSVFIVAPSFASNTTGLTAAIVATKGQVITGTVNAAGYDIGIYVGPGVTGVVIKNAKIFGANDHGIFIQDTSGIVVKDSNITGNGTPLGHASSMPEDKAITLSGTTGCVVKDNFVEFNLIDGGIAVTDDGSFSPGALNPGSPHPAIGNVIMGNHVENNIAGCGIVVASYNPGEGVAYNIVADNTVIGNSPGPFLPYIGGIVVAADTPSTTAKDNLVLRNKVIGGWIPGIIVHSNAPGDFVTGTIILHNALESNGAFPPSEPNDAQKPAGINIVAETPTSVLANTLVICNTVTNNYYGAWHLQDTNTKIMHLQGNAIVPIAP
jgi:hypothetical protein